MEGTLFGKVLKWEKSWQIQRAEGRQGYCCVVVVGNWGVEGDENGQVSKACLQRFIYCIKEVYAVTLST